MKAEKKRKKKLRTTHQNTIVWHLLENGQYNENK